MASTPSASQLGLFHRTSLCTFLLKNLQCFKCLLLGPSRGNPASSPSHLSLSSPYSRQHPNLTLQMLQVFADGPRPAEAFLDMLSFPKRVLYFLSVNEYPSVWFHHLSGTGQVVLGFVLCVTDPAGPPLVHLVPAPCQTAEGTQHWMKLREEASVGKQLCSHLLTLKRPARAACRWLLKGTASIRGLREGKSLRRLTEGHWGTEASS